MSRGWFERFGWRKSRYHHGHKRRPDADCMDDCDCDCDVCDCNPCLLILNVSMLLRVAVGAVPRGAVDPHTAPPASRAGRWAARLVRSYQLNVSVPRAHPVCPMTPTCSRYALQALSSHGLVRGGWLIVRRLRRCSRPGRVDPVPTPR